MPEQAKHKYTLPADTNTKKRPLSSLIDRFVGKAKVLTRLVQFPGLGGSLREKKCVINDVLISVQVMQIQMIEESTINRGRGAAKKKKKLGSGMYQLSYVAPTYLMTKAPAFFDWHIKASRPDNSLYEISSFQS